ncbi:DUF4815 domain-containing protein [Acidovorax sp. GBBC 3332]|nr:MULTISPECIES: DUF4815 domain-containing protein [unclassified Acidovorax]MDA8449850.1 DUF4815 domain-containing protein [Acidovorax sp. GBBC 3297]MDA8459295.1 DUF4815 domain-containing protein [Acidovorax sp. GBBC 3333]MDA8464332.1 DUF4815 domain-containing protein [Acidovorax sp. GBBC 3332]MDA8469457.1 DUF4815 domain-containing protein [Acidovorax sp. GBBC 3299]
MASDIQDTFDPTKNYHRVLFRQDKLLQSRELIDLQRIIQAEIKGVADTMLRDGDVARGARIVVNPTTGAVQAEAGAVYLQGAVRGVVPAAFVVPVKGIVTVGIYLRESIVTELEDPGLLGMAGGTPSYGEPGAARLKVEPTWGYAGDGQQGEFFAVWTIEDGYLRAKETPPSLDPIARALQGYDVDSTGGAYVVSGLDVAMADDLSSGEQVYTVTEGRARVRGVAIEQVASKRLVYAAKPDVMAVDSEPHLIETDGAQRIDVGRPPYAAGTLQVRVTMRKTVTLVHGGFAGAADPLPDPSVIQLEKVQQGSTVYTASADFKLSAGQVDWSPSGAEPAPGSNYQATYLYTALVAPTAVDARGGTVTGAVKGTTAMVSYSAQLRRIDRLCLARDGTYAWVQGVSSAWTPTPPVVPNDMLLLASVYQTWDADRRVIGDCVKMVPMPQLVGERQRLDSVILDLAELRLATSAQGVDSGIKKGLFADAFLNDAQRDAGIAQSAAIVRGTLQLPLTVTVHQLGKDIGDRIAPAHSHRTVLSQAMRTGAMLVNPYMAFDPIPAAVELVPNVDRWTDVQVSWSSPITERFYTGSGSLTSLTGSSNSTRVLSEESRPLEYLRPITVRFNIKGWGPREPLASVTFDGIAVTPQPLPGGELLANAAGELSGTFVVPTNVSAGTKAVVFVGTLGSRGSQTFMGQGTALLRSQQSVTSESWNRYDVVYSGYSGGGGAVWGPSGSGSTPAQLNSQCSRWLYEGYFDPLAQTFMLDDAVQCSGVRLWFTTVGGPVVVQIRETANGVPTAAVVAERRMARSAITAGQWTTVEWVPAQLQARTQYALVVLCDDAQTALAVAQLGKQDPVSGYVTSQPYQVGVLLSSSNANTWTPHQDTDAMFQVLAAQYTERERVIDLGSADLVDATDLMVLGFAERPNAAAGLTFDVEFPPSMQSEVVRLTDGQVVWLSAPFTGTVKVRARITGDANAAAILGPGVQLVAGKLATSAPYVSRTVTANGQNRLVVVFEADIPGGSSVQVHAQATEAGSPWVLVPYLSASTNTAGVREITHRLDNFAASGVRVRLTLTGNTKARPFVGNLRMAVI